MKSIAKQLENREVPICPYCKENPMREGCKTCSDECSKENREWTSKNLNSYEKGSIPKELILDVCICFRENNYTNLLEVNCSQ